MANGIKEFKIVINGITESVSAVDALNKQLDALEKRIEKINSMKVTSTGSSGSGSRGSGGALSEEERVQREINKLKEQGAQLDAKIAAAQDEVFKRVDATKELYKETLADQKAIAAQERLTADAYSNTMVGMKQQLADLKSVIQTTDLGDGESIEKMTKKANELTNKLKEMETAYGQFGRNVGNYQSAFDGLQKLSISIGGVTREFGSAREATKTLKNELIGLEVAGQGDSDMAKELRTELYKLQSAMDDATKSSKAMDEAMDFMESFTAMASIGNGMKAFFGFDDSEIQKSIQKLVSLQNVLQGIEKLRKQMETGEGFGKMFSAGSKAIDTFVAKITGAKIATDGLTMSSRVATVAVRGLSMALKAIGVGLVMEGIALAVEGIQSLIRSLDTAKIKEDALDSEVKALNRSYEQRKDLLAGQYMSEIINAEEYLARQYEIENEYIERQISLLQQRADLANDKSWYEEKWFAFSGEENGFTGQRFNGSAKPSSWNSTIEFNWEVKSIEEAEEAWKKLNEAVKNGNDYFTEYGKGINDWMNSLFVTVQQTEDVMKGMGNIVLSDTIGEFQELEQKFRDGKISAEEFAKGLKELTDKMNSNEVLNSVIANLDKYIPDEEVREKVENILRYLQQLNDEFNAVSESQVHHWNQVRIDAMEEGAAKIAAQMAEDERHEIAQYAKTEEQKELIQKKYQRKRLNELKKHNKQAASEAKRHNREILEAEKDLANLRIANMKEGLNKVLKQLEEERKQRLAKVEADGLLVAERQAEINLLYDKKVLEAKKEWAEKVEKMYKDMWDNIYEYSLELTKKVESLATQKFELGIQNIEYIKDKEFNIPDYGVQGVAQLSKSTKEELEIQENYNKELDKIYAKRRETINSYWLEREKFETTTVEEIYQAQIRVENKEYEKQERDRLKRWKEQQKVQEDWYAKKREDIRGIAEEEKYTQEELDKELINVDKEYHKTASIAYQEYITDYKLMAMQHEQNLERIEQEKVNKIRNINMESYRQRLQELRDFQTAIANLESKQPVYNVWGITNFKQTNANYKILLNSYKKQAEEILKLKKELQKKLDSQEITFDDFQNANRELDTFVDNLGQKMDEVKYKLSWGGQIQQAVKDMQQYLQEVSQSFQQIMSAVWDAQDNQFEKEQEELDKLNEELDKKLDEQEEIVQSHKDAIESIEDELATARGDRRQHLIDQLNAEMQAQRDAIAQEKKIQKEKEALQKKEDALELKRKKAQYHRDQLQAIVNGAMAVTYAAANNWPIPAIPLMSLAASTTAAQIAIMAANKPYAKGGLLEGKSHAQGGIPIPGTGIEVEGKEYVIRKKSTAPNIDLLDYINKSERKLDLSDFIDFYSSGKPKRIINGVSGKFADGGYMPTLPNALDIRDQLQNVIVNQDNRPIYVSVVDINNKQDDVRRVQALAGLEQ